ncbi:unnamed protein product [Lactuca virosa]|uniref:Uncharacterized protein n=1 Tax=Lactuca virosa TaxID=75947 RepID=A0AAU9PFB5_9ASTR|nr:unnamed protein product [Lactuca virosa]CAH1448819.1 unnamed protein product [Lactuca virosa]
MQANQVVCSTEKTRLTISKPMGTEMSQNKDVRIEMQSNQSEMADNVNYNYAREWEFCIHYNETIQLSKRKRQMEKVPPLLLKGEKGGRNRQCYEPAVVSLGPYHHKRDDLAAAEKYKLITLEEYSLSSKKTMDSLYNKVFEVVQDARKCYVDGSTDEYNDNQFNQMMLRDGCFVLFFIDCIASRPNTMLMLNNEYLGALGFMHVARDILLLENQIPFIVLQVLLDLRFPKDRGERILNEFFNYLNYGEITTREEKVLEKKQPLHLLELYRSYFISLSSSFDVHANANAKSNYVKRNRSFASVTELKAKGIFLKRINVNDESSNEDIRFHSHCCYGELELVRRAVYSNSKAIYLNMIAYELCPHNPNDLRVSTYIRVMKSLVIHRDDVKELRENKILLHSLGRDEDVVKMYDEIETLAVNVHMFNQIRRGIEKHCNNKYKTWAAELINVYFCSPWKTVALLVATAILFTSFLQTYFAIRPPPDESSGDMLELLRHCVHSKPPSAPT